MTWCERVIAAHTAVTDSVSHGQRLKSSRYFVWTEDGSNDRTAEGQHKMPVVTGHTDLFTKTEFDSWADALGESLSGYNIAWTLSYTDFEEDTGFWHYRWDWEAPA